MTTEATPGPVLRFLLATGLRLGVAYNGHRMGQYWGVPAKMAKNGREHRVWLSELALGQVEAHPWKVSRSALQQWLEQPIRRTSQRMRGNTGI